MNAYKRIQSIHLSNSFLAENMRMAMFMPVCNNVAAKLKKFVPFVIMKLKSGFHLRRSGKQSRKSTYESPSENQKSES